MKWFMVHLYHWVPYRSIIHMSSNHLESVLKHGFWFLKSAVRPKVLHFYLISRWFQSCGSWTPLRVNRIYTFVMQKYAYIYFYMESLPRLPSRTVIFKWGTLSGFSPPSLKRSIFLKNVIRTGKENIKKCNKFYQYRTIFPPLASCHTARFSSTFLARSTCLMLRFFPIATLDLFSSLTTRKSH